MNKTRLEAFSDGVLAIIITIMVLELKVPHVDAFSDLFGLWPIFFSYVLSFIFIGIYWNNHHHMLHAVQRISGSVLLGNLHLLFWLSLVPFVTGLMGENHFADFTVALYGVVLLACAISYFILQNILLRQRHHNTLLAEAVGKDRKGKLSLFCYVISIPLAYVDVRLSLALFIFVAAIWLVPDRRIERVLEGADGK